MAVSVDTRRRMNDHRRRLFDGTAGQIAFVCECDDEECTRTVPLTREQFDELRTQDPSHLLHRGHLRA